MDTLGSGGPAVAGRRAAGETRPGEWREPAGGEWAIGGAKADRSADRAGGSRQRVDGAGVRHRRGLVGWIAGVAGWWYTHWLQYPAAVGETWR
jgi:hypothetical protein